ncbi:MAG: NAD(P)H-hydrate dehydratase [Anaerolineaceae bacterium]
MRTIGAAEQRVIEEAAARAGVPAGVLMERAGRALAERIMSLLAERGGGPVSILCGPGNNGGDGYAAARFLTGKIPDLHLYEDDSAASAGADAQANRAACRSLGIQVLGYADFNLTSGIVLDAVYGSGFRAERNPKPDFMALSQRVQASRRQFSAYLLSADIPSGVQADNGAVGAAAFQADETLCFILPKTGVWSYPGRKFAGLISVNDLGLGQSFIDQVWEDHQFRSPSVLTESEVRAWRPERAPDSHKGSFGRLAIMSGSVGLAGAAVLCARAAQMGGAGYVDLLVPQEIYPAVLAAVPSVLSQALPADANARLALWQAKLESCSSALVGPGLGKLASLDLVLAAIAGAPRLVLDADALNLLALPENLKRGRAALLERGNHGLEPAVLTPHPGEFGRLCPEYAQTVNQDRIQSAEALARMTGSVVVLKGAGTVVAFPEEDCKPEIWINSSGNAGMAKAGSGDVLAGLLASFLAQKLPLREAALSAVYLHGLSADLRANELTERALTPEDTLAGLPAAFRQVGWDR